MAEIRKEKMQKEAQAIIDAALDAPGSPIRKKLMGYLSLADRFYKEGNLYESRRDYALAINMGKSLENQAQEYINGCAAHYDALDKKNEEAAALYRSGKIEEAKKLWEDIKNEARPRPLEFAF